MSQIYILINAALVEARTTRGPAAECCSKLKKAVAIHDINCSSRVLLLAKTILIENYRCISTNLRSHYAKSFKIKTKKAILCGSRPIPVPTSSELILSSNIFRSFLVKKCFLTPSLKTLKKILQFPGTNFALDQWL